MSPESERCLRLAFPSVLSDHLDRVLETIPGASLEPAKRDRDKILIRGEQLHIPYRVYFPEPEGSASSSLSAVQMLIMGCIYTRHHNGFARQKHLEQIIPSQEFWIPPFVLLLLGEYVVEIIDVIDRNRELISGDQFISFIKENREFFWLTKQRVISYWNCYYRNRFQRLEEYAGFRLIRTLEELSSNAR